MLRNYSHTKVAAAAFCARMPDMQVAFIYDVELCRVKSFSQSPANLGDTLLSAHVSVFLPLAAGSDTASFDSGASSGM